MIATALSVTYPRSLVIDFTIPFSYDPLALMIPFPELDSTVNRIVKPFQPEVGYYYEIKYLRLMLIKVSVQNYLKGLGRNHRQFNRCGNMPHLYFSN